MAKRLGITAALVLGLWAAEVAYASPPAFDQAMKDLVAGDLPRAQQGFATVGAQDDTGWADDGLREAGRVAEMRGAYVEAQQFYRALVIQHPTSPFVRFAHARLAYLARTIGEDAAFEEVHARREALMQQAASMEDPAPVLVQYEAMLRGAPDLPTWPDAATWLGERWLLQGDIDRGLAWLAEVAARPGANAGARQRAFVAALLQVGRLDAAAAALAQLPPATDIAERAAVAELHRKLRKASAQAGWRIVAKIWVAVFGLVALGFAVWRHRLGAMALQGWSGWWLALAPGLGVMYVVPVGAALIAFSSSRQPMVAAATIWIVIGSIVTMWLLELVLRTRPRALTAAGFTLGAVAAAAAIIYVAVTQDRLIDMLLETWRYGHDG